MPNPALTYAEDVLGVHKSYERATLAHAALDEITTSLDKAQDLKRALADTVASIELDILIAERGKHASMSEAALERHVKEARHQDAALQAAKKQLGAAAAEVGGLEYDADIQRSIIKIETARMEELGGYFRYLAAVKEAENLTKRTQQETPQ